MNPNPITKTTALRAYAGWIVRTYADGTFDAVESNGLAISPAVDSFRAAVAFVRESEAKRLSPNFVTIADAVEYVDRARESESEQRAEYGSGAVSLGYDPYEWSAEYDGYRASDDPLYAEAAAIVRDRYEVVKVTIRRSAAWRAMEADSIPF
jgi:hypothetical protein